MNIRVSACSMRKGGVWEPEEQIDLESFNTNIFFELLLRQSQSVTAKLGHFKEEVKCTWGLLIYTERVKKLVMLLLPITYFVCTFVQLSCS